MTITISTKVEQHIEKVWQGFDETLFRKLSPPFPPVRIVHFLGCKKGDEVYLELNFVLTRQYWKSLIIEQKESDEEIYFIDKGTELPFFLSFWQHKHRILKNGSGSIIRDEIEFSTPTILTNYFFYPLLYLQFLYRKPVYKKVFKKPTAL